MPRKEYSWLLDASTRVVVMFNSDKGKVVRFVVKLEYRSGGEWSEVARYDVFHGYVHHDMIDMAGEKTRTVNFRYLGLKSGLNSAIVDFKRNFQRYVERWHHGKKEEK